MSRWVQIARRMAQGARLMVGVGDYDAYLAHMQERHPGHTAMTREQYFRHCVEARYPKKGGRIQRCPC